ncbi:MAG: DUF4124 domain-containing protein [Desulfobacteraceae bacterium]
MKTIIVLALAIGLLSATNASSDIYTWTDDNGVQRFGNDPPENVENYQRIESKDVRPDSSDASDKRRSSYDRMVEQANQETRRLNQESRAKEAARVAEEKRLEEQRRQAKIKVERERLLDQIEAIKNRAVSPTYPPGMKQAQIDKIQKQINALEKNPDADASSKQEETAEPKSGH